MNIIIAGAGDVGVHLTQMLCNENHNVVVIDRDKKKLLSLDSHYDVLTVEGSCSSFSTLEKANVKDTDLLIAVTSIEETNIITAILGKRLGAKTTVVRAHNKEYLEERRQAYLNSLGIDSIICTEMMAAKEIVGLLKQVGTTEVFDFSGGKLSLFVVKLDNKAPVLNKTLKETSKLNKDFQYTAVAITRGNNTIIPRGSDVFKENDLVYVITTQSGIKNLLKYSGKKKFEIHDIMILGGSRIGIKTASDLEKHLNIKLIEQDQDKCFKIADKLDKTLVINGDGANIDLLMEEGIERMDAFIAVTGNSETNILSCLLAKKMGVKRTIAEIENIDYIDLAENIGIDTIINKKLIAASRIFRYTMNAEVASIKCLTAADAELLEFLVRQGAPITKKTIREIQIPKGAIIGGVVRNNKGLIAKGDMQIQAGDKVIVFALPEAIHDIQSLFN